MKKILISEQIYKILSEKIMLTPEGNKKYAELVAEAYNNAPLKESRAIPHYDALNQSNYLFWKRLLSKINVVFCSEYEGNKRKSITINGVKYPIIYHLPYESQSEMKKDLETTGRLLISIDYSVHPYFSLQDNIVFRTVHDYIVHILGNKQFGVDGELKSYNLHAKLVPPKARPAIFTEIVGQACYVTYYGEFPTQKVVILDGFDYDNVGKVENYDIVNKQLIKKGTSR